MTQTNLFTKQNQTQRLKRTNLQLAGVRNRWIDMYTLLYINKNRKPVLQKNAKETSLEKHRKAYKQEIQKRYIKTNSKQ